MRLLQQLSAKSYSTFALDTQLAELVELDSLAELMTYQPVVPPLVLGEGSNSIFLTDQNRTVLRYLAKSRIVLSEDEQQVQLHIEAGDNWHQLVNWTVAQGWWGLENLSLIPGSVGAAPVQNIGAYGVELADCCDYVDFFHWQSREVQRLTKNDCGFAYRDSLFKSLLAGQGLIVAVGLTLKKQGQPKLGYKGLEHLNQHSSVTEVADAVIAVRQSKLPDPAVLPNCGSFFKNPVVSQSVFDAIQSRYPEMPFYPQANGQVKLAAGWLIEQTGLKGQRIGDVGCYEKQALVLVNFGRGTAADLQQMIALIQQKVLTQFAVQLEPEVRLLDQ
ncbi:UDP-N-acetylenolpyruvoylglucosamine reductase [Rheinheimera sp. A13L]|uniref:UDP-N-acetylmuramate dehydrogenase n=1 Tax=Rheinheimera sp. A13L TaxID=506534 RepID=UPI0002124EFC|nr:UDP-N-acetylmuramate dehydrogenase [Rheinheimera sp. A13L]EGM77017.1 UDP-N-acetylenolpyruvoylglucosamine reductase [Rheinheimera sp. A13L]